MFSLPLATLFALAAGCSKPATPDAAAKADKTETTPDKSADKVADAATPPAGAAAEKGEAKPAAPADSARGVLIDHEVVDIEGKPVKLADYRGKAVMIVNTASNCGFTPQYAKLQELYGRYKDKGLVVLGFPSNDYGGQEPGTNEEISDFVASKYSVEFPMMDKVATSGDDKIELYRALTEQGPEDTRGEVRWNFTKFLVDKEGYLVGRFESAVDPMSDQVVSKVEATLGG